MSRCVWALSDEALVSRMTENSEPNAKNWMFELYDTLDNTAFTRMAVTLWSIWFARRKAIYEGIFRSPQQTSLFVNTFIGELEQIEQLKERPTTRMVTPAQPKRWLPPPAGVMKMNVDGAVAKNHHGGQSQLFVETIRGSI